MKYCNKCGKELDPKEKFCSGCGNNIVEATTATPEAPKSKVPEGMTEEENKKANKLGIISLLLYFAGPGVFTVLASGISGIFVTTGGYSTSTSIFQMILYSLRSISSLAAIVIMIILRVKYPKNVLGKVIMWIYISLFILGIIGIIIVFVVCYLSCASLTGKI